nr:MAG TPA: hypothetical protein [Caudoviricetes sp.]
MFSSKTTAIIRASVDSIEIGAIIIKLDYNEMNNKALYNALKSLALCAEITDLSLVTLSEIIATHFGHEKIKLCIGQENK